MSFSSSFLSTTADDFPREVHRELATKGANGGKDGMGGMRGKGKGGKGNNRKGKGKMGRGKERSDDMVDTRTSRERYDAYHALLAEFRTESAAKVTSFETGQYQSG